MDVIRRCQDMHDEGPVVLESSDMQKSICTPKALQPQFLITTLTHNLDLTDNLN